MKLAFVYAGQGSQKVNMGADLYQNNQTFKAEFDKADPTGIYKNLCFNGSLEELSYTPNTQPCMVAFACSVTKMLEAEGIVPTVAAGLSLGEYSALSAAGVWDSATATSLAAFRGKAMAEAVKDIPSGMAAVLGMNREDLQEICKTASEKGIIQIANYNCPGQLVIGGELEPLNLASALAKEKGAKRVLPLNVSGPFHTSLMAPAGEKLAEKFKEISFGELNFPIIFNATAKPMQEGENLKSLLVKQVQSSVYFEDTVVYMQSVGIDTIIEIGPGKTLSGFVRKIAPEIKTYSIEDTQSFNDTILKLKGEL